jgi:peptidoglycan/xylan/chitin deacetylase (PgdA/CDA1 family)
LRKLFWLNQTFSAATWFGLAAFAIAGLLASLDLRLATVPLAMFIIVCLVAPLIPWLSFFLPVISKGTTGKPTVALTFDDGPDPASTPALLALLERNNLRATFFVTGQRAERYPELMADILKKGHTVGNHSYRHSTLAMLCGPAAMRDEIASAQKVLERFGIMPLAFRPPVGIMTPALGQVLTQLGMYAVNFRFRPFDGGNRRLRNLARFTLGRVRPDDILVLHDLKPANGHRVDQWLVEIERILVGLGKKGLTISPLETLIGRPVMSKAKS